MLRLPAALPSWFRIARTALVLPALGVALVAGADAPARAQDVANQALEQRVERLESEVGALQRQVVGGTSSAPVQQPAPLNNAPPPPTVAAALDERISRLEDEMQNLTGQLQVIGHNTDMLKEQLDKLSKDVDFRLSALEKGGPPAAGAGPAPAPATQGARPASGGSGSPGPVAPVTGSGQVLPVGTPQQQYDYARALLIQQDYAGAEKAFSAFLNVHPNDALSGAAQFWLGETYYVRGNYDQAAKAFAEGIQRYPKSSKAPDTLLKLGMALSQLHRTKDACGVYSALAQRYPNAAASIKQQAERERQRSGCS